MNRGRLEIDKLSLARRTFELLAVNTYETDPQGRFTPRLSTHAAGLPTHELAACNTLAATKMQLGWYQNNT